ncbi:phytoene desaturase [soil metagenome]
MSTHRPRAVVIGAGFGGLALAVRLQAAGLAVTLIEKRDKPGGRAYVYEDEGFTFDAGPTVITDPACLEEVFAAAGRRMADYVELMPVEPFYRLAWEDGTTFDYSDDQAALDRQIASFAPRDVAGYRRFLEYSEAVYEEGYVKLGAVPFLSFADMLRVAPKLARLQAWRSVHGTVARFISDEKLRQVFSFHSLLVVGNPFATSSIYALIHALERRGGVWFARGGTGALIRALVRLFEEIGGRLRLSLPAERISVEEGRVTGVRAGGETLPAELVASNGDVVHTYRDLLAGSGRGRSEAARLAGKRFSMSLFVVYFGLRANHRQLAHHTVCFGPRYRGLLDDIFKGSALASDFSLYLHAPSVSDASLAPPGCASYYALAPVPHLGRAPIDWAAEGPGSRDRVLAYLEARYIPNLRRDLVTVRHITPFDFRDELNAHLGSAFSLEPILSQSAWFRPHNRDGEIGNLYLVGAGTHPGAGVPGVIGSAKATAGLIIEDWMQRMPAAGAAAR